MKKHTGVANILDGKKRSDTKYPQEVHLRSGRQFYSIACIFRTPFNTRKNIFFGRKIVSRKKKSITSSSRDQPDIQTLTEMNIHFSHPMNEHSLLYYFIICLLHLNTS